MLSFINHTGHSLIRYAGMRSVISFGLAVLFSAATLVSFQVTDASAQSVCFERTALLKHLSGKFEEAPVAAGLAANGSVVEVFSSPDGLTWTIVLTQPNGATCVMASGESWVGMKQPKKGKVS
ncbi:hypothetical protein GQF03_04635 [Sneathiella chungangensis]|uniref:Uncharacterized protein n=1 Tax=Sneathiella chungangensis TaxID=1418234 RepID=A0A845MCA2_9PROT|nr:hypothetical protein [Sneathiella chungangensis]MZR21608.1 hypothetical protein [Sneathiella chungangensis]